MSPRVAVIMGSSSDWETMEHCVGTLKTLEIPHEVRVLSAHRTPDALESYVEDVEARGAQVFVAAAGEVGRAGAVNAALLAAAVLALEDAELAGRLNAFRKGQAQKILAIPDPSV